MAPARRASRRELAREIRDVIEDLPICVSAPLDLRLHLHCGTTRAEIASALPGDAVLARPRSSAK